MFKIISQLRGGQFFAYRFSNLHQICTTFKLGLVDGLKNVGYAIETWENIHLQYIVRTTRNVLFYLIFFFVVSDQFCLVTVLKLTLFTSNEHWIGAYLQDKQSSIDK